MKTGELLQKHGLRKTPIRQNVLDILHNRKLALSQTAIENELNNKLNRVTVYRVLKDLENAGLAHRTVNMDGTVLFAGCKNECPHEHHHDTHLHFSCIKCKKVYCLDNVQIPKVSLPRGFTLAAINMLVSGTCKACTK